MLRPTTVIQAPPSVEKEIGSGGPAETGRRTTVRVINGESIPMEPLVYVPADDSRFGAVVIVLDHKRGRWP